MGRPPFVVFIAGISVCGSTAVRFIYLCYRGYRPPYSKDISTFVLKGVSSVPMRCLTKVPTDKKVEEIIISLNLIEVQLTLRLENF